MNSFNIQAINQSFAKVLQKKIDNKTKPIGALGYLEEIALKIGTIQESLEPTLKNPTIVVFAGDHGIALDNKVNPFPQEVTAQMVYNFLNGGAAINIFCKQHDIDIKIVDAGVNHDFKNNKDLIDAKIAMGTKNYLYEAAMTTSQCEEAIKKGADIVTNIHNNGTNIIGFGEMGIGNTSSASILMSQVLNLPIDECVGGGTGLDTKGIEKKKEVLSKVLLANRHHDSPLSLLSTYGGFEIAMMCGGMLKAAELKMIILIDGFICTSSLLIASKICPTVLDYCLFAHTSNENGHQKMLDYLKAKPILQLNMRLGEGTGAALAFPIIQSAVNFLNKMASFESASVTKKNK